MASNSAEDQSKTTPSHPPVASNQAPTVAAPAPAPATGYPPVMGYTQYPQAGYPSAYPGYPPTAPPPAAFYTSQPYPSQPPETRTTAFAKHLLAALIILVIISCMMSVVLWFALRPQKPEFRVDSLLVSNFNTTNSTLTANWEVNITATNPNGRLKISFDEIESVMCYKEIFLSVTALEQFRLETKEQKVVRAKFPMAGVKQPDVDGGAVAQMEQDRKSGTVSFNLRIRLWSKFKAPWWTRHMLVQVICDNLDVGFVGAMGSGSLTGGASRECFVFV